MNIQKKVILLNIFLISFQEIFPYYKIINEAQEQKI